MSSPSRILELDGIRGWASLSVVLFHMFYELFGVVQPFWRTLPVAALMNGPLAVTVFFVLSGDALSYPYFARGYDQGVVIRTAVGRYFRLLLPIVLATLVVFALLRLNASWGAEASQIVRREDWEGLNNQFNPTLKSLVSYLAFGVFSVPYEDYIPFLWTMPIELTGSFLVFLSLLIVPYLRIPYLIVALVGAALLAAQSYLSCFFFGMLLALTRADGRLQMAADRIPSLWSTLTLIVLLGGAALAHQRGLTSPRVTVPLAVIVLLTIYVNRPLVNFFANAKVSQFLGRISFPVYLIHYSVLISVSSILIVNANDAGGISLIDSLLIASSSVVASLIAATIFSPLELTSHRLSKTITSFILIRRRPRLDVC